MATFVLDIERKRGDTRRMTFTVKAMVDGVLTVVPIGSWTVFKLTVDPEKKPVNADNNIGQLEGSLSTDGSDGKMYFVPPGTWPIGAYYYDVQALDDNTEKTTVVEGKYKINQDITKD